MSAAWDIPRVYRVARRRRDTAQVSTLELVPDVPMAEPGFEPGQFNMVFAFGIGEVPLSISGDPEAPGTLAHTVKNVGPVSG
ncbi:MAG: Ni/Fe hydrogenase subunit gamma, partial [Chloroflexota bacterium]